MMRLERVKSWVLFLLALFLVGCNPVSKASPDDDRYAKELTAPADKALVYVVLPTNLVGYADKMKVRCNGKYLGATGGKRFIYAILDPGSYVFVSEAENKSELAIVLEAGKTYYLEQKVKMGILKARNSLERLSDTEGKEKLSKCSLSADMVAPSPVLHPISKPDRTSPPNPKADSARMVLPQDNCKSELKEAEEKYNIGFFSEALEILNACLNKSNLSQEEKLSAYRLQALAYLAKDLQYLAKRSIQKILELEPNYEPDPIQDPPSFTQLVEEAKKQKLEKY